MLNVNSVITLQVELFCDSECPALNMLQHSQLLDKLEITSRLYLSIPHSKNSYQSGIQMAQICKEIINVSLKTVFEARLISTSNDHMTSVPIRSVTFFKGQLYFVNKMTFYKSEDRHRSDFIVSMVKLTSIWSICFSCKPYTTIILAIMTYYINNRVL